MFIRMFIYAADESLTILVFMITCLFFLLLVHCDSLPLEGELTYHTKL